MHKNIILSIIMALAGCSFVARGQERYRSDVRALLAIKDTQIEACYEDALRKDPTSSGTVVLNLRVKKKTGVVTDLASNAEQSTAPPQLRSCVEGALAGLQLDPEDRREGRATITFVFEPDAPSA